MSRPSTGRTERFELRVTPEESTVLFMRAEEAGCKTLSDFVRARLLDGTSPSVSIRAMSIERAKIVRELTRVGERLNLLAHLCAHDDALRVESEACLRVLRETIESVCS
jgi:hypothetical protein